MSEVLNSIFFYLQMSITKVSVNNKEAMMLGNLISFKLLWMNYLNETAIGKVQIELNAMQGEYNPFLTASVNRFRDPPTENAKS